MDNHAYDIHLLQMLAMCLYSGLFPFATEILELGKEPIEVYILICHMAIYQSISIYRVIVQSYILRS